MKRRTGSRGDERVDDAHHRRQAEQQLLSRARQGETEALAELFRAHRLVALAYAGRLAGPSEADDLVSAALLSVLEQLAAGRGPDLSFRSYLLKAIYHQFITRLRGAAREAAYDEIDAAISATDRSDDTGDILERLLVRRAFQALPEPQRVLLWSQEVEGESQATIAARSATSASTVAVRAYRARQRLRTEYLAQHLQPSACGQIIHTARFLRGELRTAQRTAFADHLSRCSHCSGAVLELTGVASRLPLTGT